MIFGCNDCILLMIVLLLSFSLSLSLSHTSKESRQFSKNTLPTKPKDLIFFSTAKTPSTKYNFFFITLTSSSHHVSSTTQYFFIPCSLSNFLSFPVLLATFPPLMAAFFRPPEPKTTIFGGPDVFINRGSNINLTCVVDYTPKPPSYVIWKHSNKVRTMLP